MSTKTAVSGSTTLPTAYLVDLICRIFQAAGSEENEAVAISTHLVDASSAGHHSHGIVRVMRYLDWIAEGKLKPNQKPSIDLDCGAIIVVDGHQGFGQIVAPFAVDIGIQRAAAIGIAAVGVKRSGHLGRLGDWADRAAKASLCSIHMACVNGHALVAPFGGTQRRFSTAPFAIGIPRTGQTPIVLDFATSLVAEGKVMIAAKGGKPIPPDALVTNNGSLSGDPRVLYGDTPEGQQPHPRNGAGAIRAFGEHKGSGLAFMCEVLAGLMTGSGTNGTASRGPTELWSGMLGIYIDPRRFGGGSTFDPSLEGFIDFIHQTRSAAGHDGVLIPGEIENRNREIAETVGLSLPAAVWADLQATAERLNVVV